MTTRDAARDALRRVFNPPNPWHATTIALVGPAPETELEVYEDLSHGIISKNDSPDIAFRYSVNPYRGCYHGCAYCYARPSHNYLDFGAGTDFERKLLVKPNAPDLLADRFERKSWRGDVVMFSGNTDCYQPIEATWGLTRACLEICADYRNPVSIITKSALVERDLDLLVRLHERAACHVTISIPFHDPVAARALEPHAPSPARRLKVLERLRAAGVPAGVNVSPIIPGLSDKDIPAILQAAHARGAMWAGLSLVRLVGPVREVFERRLRHTLPLQADRVMNQIAACRGGAADERTFGVRMRGTGSRWAVISEMFDKLCDRLGFEGAPALPDPTTFRRPRRGPRQLALF